MAARLFMLTEAAVFGSLIVAQAAGWPPAWWPSDSVILALIAFATIIFQGWQTRQVNRVHKIVNSQRTAMENVVKKLEAELARLAAGGAPTPTTRATENEPQVTILDGVTSTKVEPPAS